LMMEIIILKESGGISKVRFVWILSFSLDDIRALYVSRVNNPTNWVCLTNCFDREEIFFVVAMPEIAHLWQF
jgi:hypothetical protein